MTTYQGGKKRLGKKIYTVINILDNYFNKDEKKPYFEPFVGMAGVLRHFGKDNNRDLYASDINEDLIIMWNELKKGWEPPKKCTKKKYERLKKSKKKSAERAFVGTVASWGGNYFQNYRLDYNKEKDYVGEGYRGLMEIKPYILNVNFLQPSSYEEWNTHDFIIYCDPPYKGNNLGKTFQNFDSNKFWNVMRKWSKNNLVIISENTAPDDFKRIWMKESVNVNKYGTKRYDDCLFIHQKYYDLLSSKVKIEIRTIII